jgi:hypothetical protein
MLPSAETVEKMSYGDPLFRMPMQSNIPITADREYLADIAGMIPFGAPAARPTSRGIQDLVRQIQTEPPTGAISPEIAARVLPETKVVSDTNKPIVAYHATGKEIDQLDPTMASGKSAGSGTFFSSNPYTASTYALGESPNVIPAYLDFKRPMVVDAQGANWNRLNKKAKVDLPDAKQTTLGRIFGDELRYVDDYASTDDLARYAKQQGYDGLVVRNVVDHGPAGRFSTDEALEPSDIYVAFDKQNIRSALSDEQMAGLLDQPAQSVNLQSIVEKAQSKNIDLQVSESGNLIDVGLIKVPKRGKGLGTEAMQDLIDYADQTGKQIRLIPDPNIAKNVDPERLVSFYERLGFQKQEPIAGETVPGSSFRKYSPTYWLYSPK